MSLLKIPFIIAPAIGIHISFSSFSPPPSVEERVEPPNRCLNGSVGDKQICTWAASSVEVANILVTRMDPSQIPEGIYGARGLQFLRALHPTPISPAFLAGSLAITIGGVLRFSCMSTLGKYWSWPLSVRREHRLVTSGPYSIVRHPSYAGFLLQYIGLLAMYGEQGSWLRQSGILQVPLVNVLVVILLFGLTLCAWMCITRPLVEDKMLQRALGKDWENWAKRVRYRLLPGVY
ncbi:uncharacterized protein HD556DRAFT_1247106 [Suillus plorans]|uniref:Protein-S-isoprenylcysteine O-methyltransferase n=1 Tax=Suillus plorans TaxID=116603 RepID=A0A9P7AFJ9_9AGAM|nr:uncharacterized protein HD556DRAFT_1247106 [Suillus plorans]KAG1787276.1 hypothetical protein HD556DRAFT_1247106 [Suillus plorans]